MAIKRLANAGKYWTRGVKLRQLDRRNMSVCEGLQ